MLPNVNNAGGSMPIKGGDAKSGNGDTRFDGGASFGGINYKTGSNPYVLVGFALLAVGAYLYVQNRSK